MKAIIFIITAMATIGIIAACTPKDLPTTEVVVLMDITDEQVIQLSPDEILGMYNLEQKWNGAIFQFQNITNVSINQTIEIRLLPKNEWLSNELDREKEILTFKNKVAQIITDTGNQEHGKIHSSIYQPIAKALNHLAQSNSQKKVLVVGSDLIENTKDVSFYRPIDLQQLASSPKYIEEKFEKLLQLNSLAGIEVHLVYQPKDETSDQSYQLISGFYQKLLEEKGATVSITANINH